MPHDNEKESRTLIQEALQDPLVRIPAPLKPAYYAHQKKLTLKYWWCFKKYADIK
ncbi:hypothetical protein ABLU22_08110 [Acinetobacter lwoffii]|uniref:hypothetical protein n=1 Tax=Acinetobacter TaxID=469 RepID=UPI001D180EA6|nr:hypothetical protein [Acinetobacter lwoffii]MDP1318297.1 hypothetical protein [Acinetobacter lwoffii]